MLTQIYEIQSEIWVTPSPRNLAAQNHQFQRFWQHMIRCCTVVLSASQIATVATSNNLSPSTIVSNSHYEQQQPQPRQLSTPTKSDRHVVKPFKSPRRKWFAAWLNVSDSVVYNIVVAVGFDN